MVENSNSQVGSERVLLTKRDAAFALSVSLRTIDSLIAGGELKTTRIGRRRLIPRRALEIFARTDHSTRPPRGGQ